MFSGALQWLGATCYVVVVVAVAARGAVVVSLVVVVVVVLAQGFWCKRAMTYEHSSYALRTAEGSPPFQT